jgi:cathepsin B
MKWILVVVLLVPLVACSKVVTDELISTINSQQSLWVASKDSPMADLERSEFKKLLGVDLTRPLAHLPQKTFPPNTAAPPTAFDSRTNWPQCVTMTQIRDQSDCGSCWAFGAVEAMSDRECIFNKKTNLPLSAEDMNSCSGTCGSCNGGQPSCAWNYFVRTGVVSEQCYPYSLPGCDHHIANSSNPCPENEYPTPPCKKTCTGDPSLNWNTDKHKGAKAYEVHGETAIMTEIQTNGPCETTFSVYDDFLSYTSGIYKHVSGAYDGGHAVKIIGWGVDSSGTKYWIVANSWNVHWGEAGFFRILKGVDECGIENTCYAGTPAAE